MKISVYSIIALCFIMSGCTLVSNIGRDLYLLDKAAGHEIYDIDFGDVRSFQDGGAVIKNNITETVDIDVNGNGVIDGEEDIWSDPEITWLKGSGDCDRIALLYINIIYVELGIKMGLVAVDSSTRAIDSGGWIDHILPYYKGQVYSPVSGEPVSYYSPGYTFTFDQIF